MNGWSTLAVAMFAAATVALLLREPNVFFKFMGTLAVGLGSLGGAALLAYVAVRVLGF